MITKRIILPWAKNVSKMTAHLLRPVSISFANEPVCTPTRLLSNIIEMTQKMDRTNLIYKIQCDCPRQYIG